MPQTHKKYLLLFVCNLISCYVLSQTFSTGKTLQESKAGFFIERRKDVHIATFNIRSNYGSDSQDWETRLVSLDSLLRMYDFDILGVQEPYKPQIDELMKLHGEVYDYYVVHTGNINSRGVSHSNPVFYRKERFKLLTSGVFWFSEKPDSVGSVSWDASQARNCIWLQLYDRISGIDFFVFNSHFDHKSALARDKSAGLLIEKIKQMAGNKLTICTGDFNTNQTSTAFKTLSTEILIDAHAIAKRIVNDDYKTSHGYKIIPPEPGSSRIDHIFISRKVKPKKIKLWKVCNETFNGKWASDHFPVFIELSLN